MYAKSCRLILHQSAGHVGRRIGKREIEIKKHKKRRHPRDVVFDFQYSIGAILSFRGVPCPNLGTGGYAFHGPYEHVTAEGLDQMVDVVLEILRIFAE